MTGPSGSPLYGSVQTLGGSHPILVTSASDAQGRRMSRNVLLVLSAPAEAKAVRRSLEDSPDGPFKVEWVSRCDDACERLRSQERGKITAVVVDLSLPIARESRPSILCSVQRATFQS